MREGPEGTRSVSLYLWGDSLEPDVLSKVLGLEPSYASAKGDLRGRPERGIRVKVGVWRFRTESRSLDIADHVDELLAHFKQWPTPLTALPGVDDAALDLFVIHREDSQEIELSLDQIATLQRLGLRLMVTMIHSSEEDASFPVS